MAAVPVATPQEPQAVPLLDAEKLDVFRVAGEFQVLASQLASAAPGSLRDQFERASVSIVLNVSEGAGRRSRRDKARFYSMSRGSAMEWGAVPALLTARQLGNRSSCS